LRLVLRLVLGLIGRLGIGSVAAVLGITLGSAAEVRAQAAREKAACALALALLGLLHLLLQLADLLLGLLNGLLQHQGALGQPVDRIGRVAQSAAQLGIGLRVLGWPWVSVSLAHRSCSSCCS
jgi:hypothetical protein